MRCHQRRRRGCYCYKSGQVFWLYDFSASEWRSIANLDGFSERAGFALTAIPTAVSSKSAYINVLISCRTDNKGIQNSCLTYDVEKDQWQDANFRFVSERALHSLLVITA